MKKFVLFKEAQAFMSAHGTPVLSVAAPKGWFLDEGILERILRLDPSTIAQCCVLVVYFVKVSTENKITV